MYALEVKAVQFFEMSEPLIQQHSITCQKTHIFYNTVARMANLVVRLHKEKRNYFIKWTFNSC